MGRLTPDGARATVATACPNCGSRRTRVICTSPTTDGTATVRRRSCEACLRRWYSFQVAEQVLPDYAVHGEGELHQSLNVVGVSVVPW